VGFQTLALPISGVFFFFFFIKMGLMKFKSNSPWKYDKRSNYKNNLIVA